MINDFTALKRKLYIGATDQDTVEHVIFGSPGWEHVPIHKAVRASAALTPFYAPQRIEEQVGQLLGLLDELLGDLHVL